MEDSQGTDNYYSPFASSSGVNTTSESSAARLSPRRAITNANVSSYMRRMKQLSAQKKAAAEADEE